MLGWETDVSLGYYTDATVDFDEDNAGDWQADHGVDLLDLAEDDALRTRFYGDGYDD